jgi:mannose-1-phosphate guanylyltransferase
MSALAGIDVAVLAGGLGTRLRSVIGDELPKVLAPVGDRPFLDVMVDWLNGYGARRLVLCLGHLADRVVGHVAAMPKSAIEIEAVIEPKPLGTGGALRFAAPHLTSDPVMVMNGDSWIDADLADFVHQHRARNRYLSMLCVDVPNASRFGRVEVDANGLVTRFAEKEDLARPGLINAGIYLLSQAAFADLARCEGPSFERDFLQLAADGRLAAHVCEGASFIDIGTPDSFAQAAQVIRP